ncbi:hypothetical protein [Clostridium sp.]|uniref:hypothetical protein n=1 Tax=Clostridium sp. TaxID=1506 RepID=UPI00262AAC1D|nr:hypothetical protein [Clostridium sp.]
MENRKDKRLIDDFNNLVSEISKDVFNKSIYRDLKLTEENLIKTLTNTSEKTAIINRNNLISLQNNLKVILDQAVEDFNVGVQNGEKLFEHKADKFLEKTREVSERCQADIIETSNKTNNLKSNIEILNENVRNINESIEYLSSAEGVNNLDNLKDLIITLNNSIELSNKISLKYIKKMEEMDKGFKSDYIKIMNCVNKLENKINLEKIDASYAINEYKELIEISLDEFQKKIFIEINEFKDLLEEGNTNTDNKMEFINSTLPKYNSDVVDSVRRIGDRINSLEKKILIRNKIENKEEEISERIKNEFDKKYNFLVLIIIAFGIISIIF